MCLYINAAQMMRDLGVDLTEDIAAAERRLRAMVVQAELSEAHNWEV
jgi:hypothetical protein